MTPGARLAAAAEILDAIAAGKSAEYALKFWARSSRFAGSKDRAGVRDHVFDALRRRRSYAALGGADTGRSLIIGALRFAGIAPGTLMTGEGYTMRPPDDTEVGRPLQDLSMSERLDMPEWLAELILDEHGTQAEDIMSALQQRAPVFLRVNLAKCSLDHAISELAKDEIIVAQHPSVGTALHVTQNARRIKNCAAYKSGLVELQDASPQAAVLRLPLQADMRVLDYCAGGGGKALAINALQNLSVFAHDTAPQRMVDLPERAKRSGRIVQCIETQNLGQSDAFNLVVADVPCSGSGTWRRDPDAKWRLTPDYLTGLCELQSEILSFASALVEPGGALAYMTCSVLAQENEKQVNAFLETTPGWKCADKKQWLPGPSGDGFYFALIQKAKP